MRVGRRSERWVRHIGQRDETIEALKQNVIPCFDRIMQRFKLFHGPCLRIGAPSGKQKVNNPCKLFAGAI